MIRDCPRCGLANPPEAQRCDCGYDFVARQLRQPYAKPGPPDPASGLRTAFGLFRVIRLGIAGMVCVGLGVALLANPIYQDDPKRFKFSDAIPGLLALVAAIGIFGLAGFMLWRQIGGGRGKGS